MLKERDYNILKFLEYSHAISIEQCSNIFFNGSYEGARRRLKQLEEIYGRIKSFKLKETGEKIYYYDRKITYHDKIVVDFISEIKRKGGSIEEFKFKPQYMNNTIIPDLKCIFSYNGRVYFTLLEVDLYHNTLLSKMQRYEELYKSNDFIYEFYGQKPIFIICKVNNNSVRYNSKNFHVLYTDKMYNGIFSFLESL